MWRWCMWPWHSAGVIFPATLGWKHASFAGQSGTERCTPCVGPSASLPALPALETHTHHSSLVEHRNRWAQAKRDQVKQNTNQKQKTQTQSPQSLQLLVSVCDSDLFRCFRCYGPAFFSDLLYRPLSESSLFQQHNCKNCSCFLFHFPSFLYPCCLLRAQHGSLTLSLRIEKKSSQTSQIRKNILSNDGTAPKSKLTREMVSICFNMNSK